MAYQALYRKYRPRTFAGILGQDHITTVLKNQIINNQVTHAYIFSGTRGTGKTSTAKIFARAVNCLSPINGEPCGECEACLNTQAENVDIIEIDAASNSGIDNIRELIAKAVFTPLYLRKKVYIIDEVHMLTTAAFNGLLKTIEEPPSHIMFILATTDPQRIPATIASRCQRFDFHRIGIPDMLKCLNDVLSDVGAVVEPEGQLAIARAADGGMRDALSIADQCLAFYGKSVSTSDVYKMLGSMDADFLFESADIIFSGDRRAAVKLVERVINEGRDVNTFLLDLTRHIRALLIAKLCGHCSDILDCTDDAMRRYEEQSKIIGEATLMHATDVLMSAQNGMKYMSLPRILLESTLLRLSAPSEEIVSQESLILRIEQLERKITEGIAVPKHNTFITDTDDTDVPPPPDTPPDTDNLPPWESNPPAPKANSKKASNMPIAAQTSVPNNQTTESTNPKDIWNALYTEFKQTEAALAVMMMKGKAISFADGVLSVVYEGEVFYKAVMRPDAQKKIADALEKHISGAKLSITMRGANSDQTNDALAAAKSAFGSKLQIIE